MNYRKYIRIHKPKIEKDDLITYHVTFSKSLRRYFPLNEFYIKYDTSIEDVPSDILAIPFLGSIITTAWAVGARAHCNGIDGLSSRAFLVVEAFEEVAYVRGVDGVEHLFYLHCFFNL